MSILLPPDSHEKRTVRKPRRIDRNRPNLLSRLVTLANTPIFIAGRSDQNAADKSSPTGKIRLVTNRWVDKPSIKKGSR